MSLYRPRKRRPEINIVPLIDVMTALIFFFLMTMHFDEIQSLSITPPNAESADKVTGRDGGGIVVAVTKAGVFYFNGKEVTAAVLKTRLAEIAAKLPGAPVLVVADERSLTKDAIYLADQVRSAGLQPRFMTRPTR
ncbi:MAG: biopolymer transporter ExbD [Puniceicoccales bacterium]|jgi:biopolymer transport protein ExbD|nr:biopolymer transporter ExbD [Puniceicoccales bacterium]